MKLTLFNGGLSQLIAPHLIETNQGVVYLNIDHDKGHFAPLKDKALATFSEDIDNFGYYDYIHDETYFTATINDYVLYKEKLYRADRSGVPEVRVSPYTFVPLGIAPPATAPDVAADGDPDASAYISSTQWRIRPTATAGGQPSVIISELSFQENLGTHISPSAVSASSARSNLPASNVEDQDSDTYWKSGLNTTLPQWIQFTFDDPEIIRTVQVTAAPNNANKVPLTFRFDGFTGNGPPDEILSPDSGWNTADLNDGVRVPTVDAEALKWTVPGGSGTVRALFHADFGESIRTDSISLNWIQSGATPPGNTIPDGIDIASSIGTGWMSIAIRDFSGGGPWPIIGATPVASGDVKQIDVAFSPPVKISWIEAFFRTRQTNQEFLLTEFEVFSNEYASLLQGQAPRDFEIQYHNGTTWVTAATIAGETDWGTNEKRSFEVQETLNIRTVTYALTYYNSSAGVESQPIFTDEIIIGDVDALLTNIPVSSDTQVDEKRIYRIGGLLTNYTLVDTIDNATTSYTDDSTDAEIADNEQLTSTNNAQAPSGLKFLIEAYAMLFGALGDKLRFTPIGEPTSWPATFFLDMPNDITGIARSNMGLLVFTENKAILVTGSGPESLSQQTLAEKIGCINHDSIVEINGEAIWASQEGIYTSNGSLPQAVSKQKMGLQSFDVVNAVYHDEKYYLHLEALPVILTQPVGGQPPKTLTIVVFSGTTVSYQWQEFTGGEWVNVTDETAASYENAPEGTYRVKASNIIGEVLSNSALVVECVGAETDVFTMTHDASPDVNRMQFDPITGNLIVYDAGNSQLLVYSYPEGTLLSTLSTPASSGGWSVTNEGNLLGYIASGLSRNVTLYEGIAFDTVLTSFEADVGAGEAIVTLYDRETGNLVVVATGFNTLNIYDGITSTKLSTVSFDEATPVIIKDGYIYSFVSGQGTTVRKHRLSNVELIETITLPVYSGSIDFNDTGQIVASEDPNTPVSKNKIRTFEFYCLT